MHITHIIPPLMIVAHTIVLGRVKAASCSSSAMCANGNLVGDLQYHRIEYVPAASAPRSGATLATIPIKAERPWLFHPGSEKVVHTSADGARSDVTQRVTRMAKKPNTCRKSTLPSTRCNCCAKSVLNTTANTRTAMIRSVPCHLSYTYQASYL